MYDVYLIECVFYYQALELNGQDLLNRAVRLDLARERGAFTPNSAPRGPRGQSQTVFVRGFDKSQGEDEVILFCPICFCTFSLGSPLMILLFA